MREIQLIAVSLDNVFGFFFHRYPWGEEAIQRARKEDKLIFLSVGYSTCHWCHVMERESFENEKVAKIMNQSFINIKVRTLIGLLFIIIYYGFSVLLFKKKPV